MGWSNQQATTLDGQAFSYTNTTIDYDAGTTVSFTSGGSMTATGAPIDITAGSTIVLDSTSDISVAGSSLPRGLVAYNRGTTDLPVGGTTASTKATAASVITTTLATAVQGRMYQIVCPGLAVRMSVAARTGILLTITENGTAPTTASTSLGEQYVNCPTNGSPVPVPISCLYARTAATGPLKVALWIWNVSGGGSTTANGSGGPDFTPVEIMVIDHGVDPGATS